MKLFHTLLPVAAGRCLFLWLDVIGSHLPVFYPSINQRTNSEPLPCTTCLVSDRLGGARYIYNIYMPVS